MTHTRKFVDATNEGKSVDLVTIDVDVKIAIGLASDLTNGKPSRK